MHEGNEREGEGEAPLAAETAPSGPAPGRPRPASLAVMAGGAILLGLVALAVYRRTAPAEPAGDDAGQASGAASTPKGGAPLQGTQVTAVAVNLSSEAAIAAERYRCVCSCNDPLSVCTCTLTPGSIDMKQYVQELVDQKKTVGEIDEAMVARYGEAVLLSNTPVPAGGAAQGSGPDPAAPPGRPRKP